MNLFYYTLILLTNHFYSVCLNCVHYGDSAEKDIDCRPLMIQPEKRDPLFNCVALCYITLIWSKEIKTCVSTIPDDIFPLAQWERETSISDCRHQRNYLPFSPVDSLMSLPEFLKLTHEDTNVFKSLHHNQRALLPQFLMISKQFLEIINWFS